MQILIGWALGLIIAGLVMAFLHTSVSKFPMLANVVLWVGIALVVIGLILLLTPVLIWVNHQLRSMMGAAQLRSMMWV